MWEQELSLEDNPGVKITPEPVGERVWEIEASLHLR